MNNWNVDGFYFYKILCNKSLQYFTESKSVADLNCNDRWEILSTNLQSDYYDSCISMSRLSVPFPSRSW